MQHANFSTVSSNMKPTLCYRTFKRKEVQHLLRFNVTMMTSNQNMFNETSVKQMVATLTNDDTAVAAAPSSRHNLHTLSATQ